MPYLSIVVPAYNSRATIEQVLASVRDSDYTDYELIVVDCLSEDDTKEAASRFADKVVEAPQGRKKRSLARHRGIEESRGEILVNIDSDVIIYKDTLRKISQYFLAHKEVAALTGLLSEEHPHKNFFSQYKNLYMHYIFDRLPRCVNFLYGSIYAIRREAFPDSYDADIDIADDTALGQRLVSCGRRIAFLNDLEVIHLKKYTFRSFLKNDFLIPFDWAKIFLRYNGWRQLGKNRTGYSHASRGQLLSLALADVIVLLSLGALVSHGGRFLLPWLALSWLLLNLDFLKYLAQRRGFWFGVAAFWVTFLDHLVMSAGILAGVVAFGMRAFFSAKRVR